MIVIDFVFVLTNHFFTCRHDGPSPAVFSDLYLCCERTAANDH